MTSPDTEQQSESRREWRDSADDSKRRRTEQPPRQDEPSREIFVSNIPYDVSQAGIESALKRMFGSLAGFDRIRKVLLHRGFAFIGFKTHDEAVAAVESHRDTKMGPRKLNIQLSNPGGSRPNRTDHHTDDTVTASLPDADCWFCLANPSFEKQLIVSVDDSACVYTSLAKGQISTDHMLICPVTHYGCYVQADESVRSVCDETVQSLRSFFNSRDQDCIVYERWIPLNATAANHMQIHVVPIPKDTSVNWGKILRDNGKVAGVEFQRVDNHMEVPEKMKGILNRVSYLYISFPDPEGNQESYLGIGKLNFTFPREVVCTGLNTMDRIDWKKCEIENDEQSKQVDRLRESILEFKKTLES